MKCRVCSSIDIREIFEGKILNKYNVKYYQCPSCGAIFTENPYWLEEAYGNNESITSIDTGVIARNIELVMKINICIKNFYDERGVYLDWGGGYGIMTRLLRDLGYNCQWYDMYTDNLLARGFEWDKATRAELITLLEVFEHFDSPLQEMEKMLKYSDSIMISTLLYSHRLEIRPFHEWWYYVPHSGQHILFCSKITMERIAEILGVNYYYIEDSLHLFTRRNINAVKLRFIMCSRWTGVYKRVLWLLMLRKSGINAMNDHNQLLKENTE